MDCNLYPISGIIHRIAMRREKPFVAYATKGTKDRRNERCLRYCYPKRENAIYKENGHFRLQPENDTMDPIILDSVTILGKAIGLYRKI